MGDKPIKVLLIESNAGDARRMREMLTGANGSQFDLEWVERVSAGLSRLAHGGIEVALSDLHLPDGEGIDTIHKLQAQAPRVPIVALTRSGDETSGIKAVQNGAEDYLLMDKIDSQLLQRTLWHAMERKQLEKSLEEAHEQTKLLLSSIPSILIGLSPSGLVTHWNAAAETTFGIRAAHVIAKPFDACGIQWDFVRVMQGVEKCRRTGRPMCVDNVRFLRLNAQEGFLGMTLIPIEGSVKERLELLIFGADITERKRLEQLKDEFVSTVSHELKTPLTVIREGVSQVLDGILGETTESQRRFLSVSLQAVDRLGRITDDLLAISKIEADKLELKMDLVDVIAIVRDIAAPSSPFQLRAKDKNLVLKANLPLERVEVYADKDKLIRVFTNLIGNALKFTDRGYVELSIEDKAEAVECSVSDSGRGIAPEDLPKVFTKFQQFGRATGPGEKGTGLGLAISRGLVEMHHGKIFVKSQLGKGTKFVFTLPKFGARAVFGQYISNGIEKAIESENSISLIVFEVENLVALENEMGAQKTAVLMEDLERSVKQSFRHRADEAVRSTRRILVLLPSTNQEDALSVARRIKENCDRSLAQTGLAASRRDGFSLPIQILYKIASFPSDGRTAEELLARLMPSEGATSV